MKAEGLDRINVQNNPVNLIDPYGLIKWGAVIRGGSAMIAGGFAVVGGAAASTTGVGAIAGVPAVIGGSATFGWGTAELISGFLDSETNIPTPSAAALGTLVATGDMEKAQKADMIQDIVTLGYGTAKFMGSAPTSDMALELFEIGNEWVYVTSQGVDYGESQCE